MKINDLFNFNTYAKYFRVNRLADDIKSREMVMNSQGYTQEQIEFGKSSDACSGVTSVNIQFEQYFENKQQRIATYRDMSRYPEIMDALDNICDDAICESKKGSIVDLLIKDDLPSHIEDELRKSWKYLINSVFEFNKNAWNLFRRWLIDGELYGELILNIEGDDIYGFKILPPHTMIPIYDDNYIIGFIQSTNIVVNGTVNYSEKSLKPGEVFFDKDQIVYINYDEYGRNRYDNIGFLEASVRTYNQLKNLEDAVVIYRIVRAPERRIWNIGTGRMQKSKADEHVRGVMQRYRKKIKYDSTTGAMDSSQNILAMVEDFWFSKGDDNEGTTVQQLESGQNLGELQDVEYFLKKLYRTLKSDSRFGQSSESNLFSFGKADVVRNEIKFSRFVDRLRNKFKIFLLDSYISLLRIRNVIDDIYIDKSLYDVSFTDINLYKEYKELEILESRFSLLGSIDAYIYKPIENENGFFSKEFILKNWFMMNDYDYNLNNKLLENEKKFTQQQQQQDDESGFGGKQDESGFGGKQDESGFGEIEQSDDMTPEHRLYNSSIINEYKKIYK